MHFLLDADLPRSSAQVLRARGHEVTDVRNVGLGSASDDAIASYARAEGLCLVTGDLGFADIRNYPPDQYHGIVVLRLRGNATARDILDLLTHFVNQTGLLQRLVGRLAIVEFGRVRLRPL